MHPLAPRSLCPLLTGCFGLDIGPNTATAFEVAVLGCRTLFWNGPMGRCEVPGFAVGTQAVAAALGKATAGGATTIIGGACGALHALFCMATACRVGVIAGCMCRSGVTDGQSVTRLGVPASVVRLTACRWRQRVGREANAALTSRQLHQHRRRRQPGTNPRQQPAWHRSARTGAAARCLITRFNIRQGFRRQRNTIYTRLSTHVHHLLFEISQHV